MIVKIAFGNGWRLYEAKEVEWRKHEETMAFTEGTTDFIEYDNEEPAVLQKWLITLDPGPGFRNVVTAAPVFILNDNGKTIDRI